MDYIIRKYTSLYWNADRGNWVGRKPDATVFATKLDAERTIAQEIQEIVIDEGCMKKYENIDRKFSKLIRLRAATTKKYVLYNKDHHSVLCWVKNDLRGVSAYALRFVPEVDPSIDKRVQVTGLSYVSPGLYDMREQAVEACEDIKKKLDMDFEPVPVTEKTV